MELTDEDLGEFVAIWKEEFGEIISMDEGRHAASQLLELYTLLGRPLPSEGSHDNSSVSDS